MTAIRDQREMIGTDRHETIEDVEEAWQTWADRHGFAIRLRQGDRSTNFHHSRKVVQAYISGGKWVADCPECNGGIACWRENPSGACLDCGTIYRVKFPSKAKTERAVALLVKRPDPATRSWHVHQGETIDALAAENDQYLVESESSPTGAVALDDVVRVLGNDALRKLREAEVA